MNAQGSSRRAIAFAVAAAASLGACKAPPRPPTAPERPGGYLTPPTVRSAERLADGAVRLSGQAPADAVVRLRSPDGGGASATTDTDGDWSLILPPSVGTPRLYAFQAELAGQTVRGEGALAILPPPGVAAAVLRAGYAGAAVGKGQPGRLQLVDFDYDGGGGAAAAGFAPPLTRVRLAIDGAVIGVAEADAEGRFALLAVTPHGAPPGAHTLRLDTPQGLAIERPVEVGEASLPPDQVFAAAPAPGGWSVSWRLPGGGAQSSLVFTDAVASAPAKPIRR